MLTINGAQTDGNEIVQEVAEVHDVFLKRKIFIHKKSQMMELAELLNGQEGVKLPVAKVVKQIGHSLAEVVVLGINNVQTAVTKFKVIRIDGSDTNAVELERTLNPRLFGVVNNNLVGARKVFRKLFVSVDLFVNTKKCK